MAARFPHFHKGSKISLYANDAITILASPKTSMMSVHGLIVYADKKSLRIKGKTRHGKVVTGSLPMKAVEILSSDRIGGIEHYTCRIMDWYTPTGWTETFLSICCDYSVIGDLIKV